MIIRPMTLNDLPEVLAIEQISFLLPWTREQFHYELKVNPYSFNFVAVHLEKIIGFINFWIIFEQANLNQIAVQSGYRKQKVGSTLLKDAIARMKQADAKTLQLEVRTHNEIALAFYRSFGFKHVVTKPKYYDNGDDAFVMELTL